MKCLGCIVSNDVWENGLRDTKCVDSSVYTRRFLVYFSSPFHIPLILFKCQLVLSGCSLQNRMLKCSDSDEHAYYSSIMSRDVNMGST